MIARKDLALIATGFLLTFWSSPGQTFFISLFSEPLRDAHQLGHAEFGALYSVATLGSAALVLWTGKLIDSLYLPHMVLLVVPLLAASLLLLAYAPGVLLLFIALLLLRHFGQGLMMLIASSSVVRYLDNMRGKASAFSGLGYVCAEALLPVTLIFLLTRFDWQATLGLFAAVIALLVLPLLLLLLRGHRQRHAAYTEALGNASDGPNTNAVAQRQWQRGEVLRDSAFYRFIPLLLAHPMLFTGFIFHQLHIVDSKGWSLELWGQLFMLYALTGIVSKLATGYVIDRVGAVNCLPFGVVPLAIALAALGLGDSVANAMLFMLLLGVATGIQTTISAPFWVEVYGSQYIGSIKSVSSFCIVTSTAIMPLLMGWLIDLGTAIETIALASIVYLAVALASALSARATHVKRNA